MATFNRALLGFLAVGFAVIGPAGAADTAGGTAGAVTPHDALARYRTCVRDIAVTVDDHQSDASTIARAAAFSCDDVWGLFQGTFPFHERDAHEQAAAHAAAEDFALMEVLQERQQAHHR